MKRSIVTIVAVAVSVGVMFADAPKGRFASITGTIRVKVLPVTGD